MELELEPHAKQENLCCYNESFIHAYKKDLMKRDITEKKYGVIDGLVVRNFYSILVMLTHHWKQC